MLKIGLTGGIGSGKTTVAKVFEILGIPVFYADTEAKRIMNTNAALKDAIINSFGKDAYSGSELNRAYIAEMVFRDPEKLERLNALVHPITKQEGEAWMQQQKTPYAIHEAALVFEAGVEARLDRVIGVFAPVEIRIRRVMERDRVSREEIINRMKRQMDEDAKMERCDFIIRNDESQPVIPQVLDIHQKLLALQGL